ncbi:MAG: polysaccharide biosynthesis tyrosine autokinase [Methylocella sp.]
MLDPKLQSQSPGADRDAGDLDLHEIVNFLWRRWKFIAGVTALAALAGMVFLARQTPVYTANAQILFDPHQTKPFGQDQVLWDLSNDYSMIENQMAIIRSVALLRHVAERERLIADPEFGSAPSGGSSLLSGIRSIFFKYAPPESGSEPPKTVQQDSQAGAVPFDVMRTIGALQGALAVTRVGQASLMNVAFTSVDPAKAARLANAVADAYVVNELDARLEAATRASAWFNDRLVDLRKQLRESEEAVAQFRAQNNLMQANANATLSQEQLGQLNMRLVAIRAETAEKKAHFDLLQKIESNGGDIASVPEVMNSDAIGGLRKQAADLSRQEADLLARYAEKYPSVVNVHAQIQDTRRQIAAEIQRIASKIADEYQLAKARQDAAEKSLQEATGQMGLDASKAITLRELERTAAVNKSLFEDFLQRSRVTKEESTFEEHNSRIITPARPPGGPSAPNKTRIMVIAVVLGLMAGAGGAYALEWLNAGFTTPREVEDMLGFPLLASISRMLPSDLTIDGAVAAITDYPMLRPMSPFSEAVRSLRSGIQMADVDHPPKVLQFTSTVPGEGKTILALSLAASAAQAGAKVLFIDCDLRHPSSSRFFGLQKEKGLVDYLIGEAELPDVIHYQQKVRHWTLPAGGTTQNPSDLLGSERMKELIEQLRAKFDLVVFDTPPTGPVIDPTVVARHLADKVVYVVRWASTPRGSVQRSVQQLSGHAEIAGVVFNYVNDAQARKYGGGTYSSYYGGGRQYAEYYRE